MVSFLFVISLSLFLSSQGSRGSGVDFVSFVSVRNQEMSSSLHDIMMHLVVLTLTWEILLGFWVLIRLNGPQKWEKGPGCMWKRIDMLSAMDQKSELDV